MSDEHASRAEIREIAREVAREVLHEIREDGIYLTNDEKMYVRRAARGAEQVSIWTRRALVMAAVSGVLWMLWEGFQKAVGR